MKREQVEDPLALDAPFQLAAPLVFRVAGVQTSSPQIAEEQHGGELTVRRADGE